MILNYTDVISCGNKTISPRCDLCPKSNNEGPNDWCGGNCKIDDSNGSCKERCKFSFDVHCASRKIIINNDQLFDSSFLISKANYTKINGFGCNATGKGYENLYEAKLACSSDSECTWILDAGCSDNDFYLCSNATYLNQSDTSCLYEKFEINGKYKTTLVIF